MVDKISELNIGSGNVQPQPHPAEPKMGSSDIQKKILALSHEKTSKCNFASIGRIREELHSRTTENSSAPTTWNLI